MVHKEEMSMKRSSKRRPTHPGEFLREVILPALDMTKVQIASSLGVSRQTLDALINERQNLTPNMACRLGFVTNTTPESWLSMQVTLDLWKANHDVDRSNIRRLK